MNKLILTIAFSLVLTLGFGQNSDIVYGITEGGSIYKFSPVNPSNGDGFSGPSSFSTYTGSAALGLNKQGTWLYYIPFGEMGVGKGYGIMAVRSIKVDGTSNQSTTITNFDMNGSANLNDLGFVRLGIDANNVGWIVAKEAFSNIIYLAKFNAASDGSATNATFLGTMTTSDNADDFFANGDLAFDINGNMYILSNHSQGGTTKIYKVDNGSLLSANGSSNTTLQFRFNVVDENDNNFSDNVNGLAFSSTGSLYVSAAAGIYFIDAASLSSAGGGNVRFYKKAENSWGLTDLATNYTVNTPLPVTYENVRATNNNGKLIVSWQSLHEAESLNYTIEASKDGNNWVSLGTVSSRAKDGNSSETLTYSFTTGSLPISLAGLSIAFLFGAVFKSRKLRLIMTIVGIGFLISCSKNISEKAAIGKNTNLYIRIANKDINQKINYSKVVKVENL